MFLHPFENCPLCQREIQYYPKDNYELIRCENCHHQFLQMPAEQSLDIKSLYQQENYYSECGGSGMTSDGYISEGLKDGLSQFYFKIRLKEVAGFVANDKIVNYLDYGCSAGQIVAMAKQELGWNALGLDLSPTSVKHAKKLGINVEQGDADSLLQAEKKFDVISLYHCLEHIIDPESLLIKLHAGLEENGLIAIEVPNIHSIASKLKGENWKGRLLPYHIHHFHSETLSRLLTKCGYRIEKIWTPYYPQSSAEIVNLAKIYRKFRTPHKKDPNSPNSPRPFKQETRRTKGTGHADRLLRTLYYPSDKLMAIMGQGEALSVIARRI